MSKKDYELIAGTIAEVRQRFSNRDIVASRDLVGATDTIAQALANSISTHGDNPRFDRTRFLVACGTLGVGALLAS